jgi:hypothetical protein
VMATIGMIIVSYIIWIGDKSIIWRDSILYGAICIPVMLIAGILLSTLGGFLCMKFIVKKA